MKRTTTSQRGTRAVPAASSASRVRRPRHVMPRFVREALASRGLTDAYRARPPYQRNDYVGWITSAKLPATQQRRLEQMLDELAAGGVYMGMEHAPSRKPRAVRRSREA